MRNDARQGPRLGNNLRELRLAFLLTPKEMAARIGTDAGQIERLERPDRDLAEEWIDAIAKGLGVPRGAVTDAATDFKAVAARAAGPAEASILVCAIGARFAIQALVGKFGGLKMATTLDEDALMTAVQNVIAFVERGDNPGAEERLSRLSQSLQITVLTVLQTRGVVLEPQFHQSMETSLGGATRLIEAFSQSVRID